MSGQTQHRVLIYAHHAPPQPSACATRTLSLARYLRARGVDVSFLTSKPGPTHHDGFVIKRCSGRAGLMRALVAHKRCSIFVTSPPATPTAEVALLARALGYHVVADIRDPFVSEALGNGDIAPGVKTRIKLWLERSLFWAAHQVSYVSDALRSQMDNSFGALNGPQILAPNGVDRDVFYLAHYGRARTREEWALRHGARLLMIAVEDAFSRPIMTALQEQARKLGVEDRVIWRNNLTPAEVAQHLNACDVGVNPLPFQRSYCLPVKTFEFLACGVYPLNIVGENSAVLSLFDDDDLACSCLSWQACSDHALALVKDIQTVRNGAEKRAEFAQQFDRDVANAALSAALLKGGET